MHRALIIGVTGQTGSYLAHLLRERDYEVHGFVRPSSTQNTARLEAMEREASTASALLLHYGDLVDGSSVLRVIQEVQPDEIYNLGAQSHVAISRQTPEYTANVVALGTVRVLEAIRILRLRNRVRYLQASTSEMYGHSSKSPQDEQTPFRPCSPYGIAKLHAYWSTVNYREAHGLHASNAIMFNHESPYRGERFVTRKITRGLARVREGLQRCVWLGNLNAERDWGYARDFARAQWQIVRQPRPDDYVIATGEKHSVREVVAEAARCLGMSVQWCGAGVDEVGVDACSGRTVVRIHPNLFRPTEIDTLVGNAAKARAVLNWQPSRTFQELIRDMVDADRQSARLEARSIGARCEPNVFFCDEPRLMKINADSTIRRRRESREGERPS